MPAGPRLHCPVPLHAGATVDLPPGAARHVQVLRLQPGAQLTLFGGVAPAPGDTSTQAAGGEFDATVLEMGRQHVRVQVGHHHAVERETARTVHLATGMPANERMDWLVEKATELGAATLQPLMTERTVLRLDAERAGKKAAHWGSIAAAACEQCGRNRVPAVLLPTGLSAWLARIAGPATQAEPGTPRLLLSLRAEAPQLRDIVQQGRLGATAPVTLLSGPEGGLSPAEEGQAIAHGFMPVGLGPRVLRAETAALMALTLLA